MLPGLILGALAGLYPGYKVYKYTWKDAGFCIQCHVHDYASVGWAKSIHGQKTTCHDCHHQPLRAYIKEAYLMVTNPPTFPADLKHTPHVPKDLCGSCHLASSEDRSTISGPLEKESLDKLPKVDQSFLHALHLKKSTKLTLLNHDMLPDEERSVTPSAKMELPRHEGPERAIECADCHGGPTNRGHNFSAVEVSCVRCHTAAHSDKSQSLSEAHGCRSCHFQDFLAPISDPRNETKPQTK